MCCHLQVDSSLCQWKQWWEVGGYKYSINSCLDWQTENCERVGGYAKYQKNLVRRFRKLLIFSLLRHKATKRTSSFELPLLSPLSRNFGKSVWQSWNAIYFCSLKPNRKNNSSFKLISCVASLKTKRGASGGWFDHSFSFLLHPTQLS